MEHSQKGTGVPGLKKLTRRSFVKAAAGVGLSVGGAYFLGCAAPAAKPTATPLKAAPTAPPARSEQPAAAAPGAAAKSPRVVTFAGTSGAAVGLLTEVAQKKGIDAKYGLKLDVKLMDPAAAAKSVLLKQTEAGLFPLISAVSANNENVPIVIFAPMLFNHTHAIVWKDAPYKSMADLKGKKIGTLDKISGLYTSAQAIFKQAGGDFEKDFELVTGPPPALMAFLERKDVEAIIIHEPVAGSLISSGKYRALASMSDEWKRLTGEPMFMIGMGAHRPWIEQNRDVAVALNKMILETAKYVGQHPEVFEQNKEFLGLKDDTAVKTAQERMRGIFPEQWNETLIKNAQLIVDRSVELKIVEAAPKQSIFMIP
ncbi:MAG: ABC transporter substrate-binding protein [Chloroflexi bacterium]|nr:ABC transporter substrate-binding protein [Chloroflexota bacterium]